MDNTAPQNNKLQSQMLTTQTNNQLPIVQIYKLHILHQVSQRQE